MISVTLSKNTSISTDYQIRAIRPNVLFVIKSQMAVSGTNAAPRDGVNGSHTLRSVFS